MGGMAPTPRRARHRLALASKGRGAVASLLVLVFVHDLVFGVDSAAVARRLPGPGPRGGPGGAGAGSAVHLLAELGRHLHELLGGALDGARVLAVARPLRVLDRSLDF